MAQDPCGNFKLRMRVESATRVSGSQMIKDALICSARSSAAHPWLCFRLVHGIPNAVVVETPVPQPDAVESDNIEAHYSLAEAQAMRKHVRHIDVEPHRHEAIKATVKVRCHAKQDHHSDKREKDDHIFVELEVEMLVNL